MKASEDLFYLIKSLSKSEKGYFKKFTSLHTIGKKNKYVHLFDIIEQGDGYDEDKVMQEMEMQEVPKNFAVLKSYLYELILKSLRLYHAQSTAQLQVKEILEYIPILFEKGLYKQCEKLIKKGKEIAVKYELFLSTIEFTSVELDLLHAQSYPGITEDQVKKMFSSIQETTAKHTTLNKYRSFLARTFFERKKTGLTRERKDLDTLKEIASEPLIRDEKKADSYSARRQYHLWHSMYAYHNEDFDSALKHITANADLMEQNPIQIKDRPSAYAFALNNLMVIQIHLKKFKELPSIINKLRGIEARSNNLKALIFYLANSAELEMYIQTGQFEKGIRLEKKIEGEISKPYLKLLHNENEMSLYYALGLVNFGAGKYQKAITYFNKIINQDSADLRQDLQRFARILNLIAHYEMRDSDFLGYSMKSTSRYLNKRNAMYKFEFVILEFIQKVLAKKKTEKELMNAFKELLEKLIVLKDDPFEKKALQYFDFISWIEAKIENRSFESMVREKAGYLK